MIEAAKISRAASRHILYCCYIVALLYMLVLIFGSDIMGEWFTTYLIATSTAAVCALIECIAVARSWSWVVRRHKKSLTTYFMTVSGLRLLCFLLVLTILFFVVGKEKFIPFVVCFAVLYVVLLCYHSLFFSHMSKKIFDEPADDAGEALNDK